MCVHSVSGIGLSHTVQTGVALAGMRMPRSSCARRWRALTA